MHQALTLARPAFRRLNQVALEALSQLGCPIYVYSLLTERVCWANGAALGLMQAGDLDELDACASVYRTDSARARLAEYLAGFQLGEERIEHWTFHSGSQPVTLMCRCTGVAISRHERAMLVEVRGAASPRLHCAELRALEVLRHTPLKISMFDDRGRVLLRNPAALEAYAGFDAARPPSSDILSALFTDPRAGAALKAEAMQERVVRAHLAMALPGRPVHAVQLSIVHDPVTGRKAYLLAQQDVSQLVEASRQIEASEHALESVLALDATPAVILSSATGEVLLANGAFSEMLQRYGGRAIVRATDFLAAEDFEQLRAGSAVETRLSADGGSFWASISATKISYAAQEALVLLLTDVNRFYAAAAALEEELTNERATTRRQQDFLAMASHEFRTPLAVIDSASQRLGRIARAGDVQTHAIARKIRNNVKILIGILDRTLETSRANAIDFRPEPSSLAELISLAVEEARDSNPHADIDFIAQGLPDMVVDPALLLQLLANLLANAVKYSGESPRVRLSARCHGGNAEIVVADDGLGISPQDREGLFKPFFRGSNCAGVAGTGLGLSIVQIIAQLHGGRVELVEQHAPGSAFRLTIPIILHHAVGQAA